MPTTLSPVPHTRVGALRDDFDRIFNRFLHPVAFNATGVDSVLSPSVDFSENDRQYTVRLEAPGVAKENIDVKLEGELLVIRGERKHASEGKDEHYVWQEREEGSFSRWTRREWRHRWRTASSR
jgi:HSP20 family protein